MADLMVATTTATWTDEKTGKRVWVYEGRTTADGDAKIVKDRPTLWRPMNVDFPAEKKKRQSRGKVEDHTADPGSSRDV